MLKINHDIINNAKLITHLIKLILDDNEKEYHKRASLARFGGLCSAFIFSAIFLRFFFKSMVLKAALMTKSEKSAAPIFFPLKYMFSESL